MATYAGLAFSNAMSFKSEGYGLLSVTCFLYHYLFDYPYNTLEPDWDDVAQSAVNLCKYGSNLIIHHAKSYQDDDTAYEDLDISARLNANADKLATKYNYLHSLIGPTIHRITINDAQLLHGDQVITGHYFR
eukprot:13217043-Ditylum_brightwellii.AAC.1